MEFSFRSSSVNTRLIICVAFLSVPCVKVLNAVDVGSVARFLPVIFNQLFHILVVTANEDVSLNVVRYVNLRD